MIAIGWVTVAVGLFLGGDAPTKADGGSSEAELAKVQGTWQLISAETDGVKPPEDRVRSIRVTIAGKEHTVRFGDQVVARGVHFEMDPTKSPKQVNDTIEDGPQKGMQILDIYKIEGDTLTSCVAPIGSDARPTRFVSKPGTGHTLRVFRRVTTGDAQGTVEAELARFEGTWRVASMEIEGKLIPEANYKDEVMVLKGDRSTTTTPGGEIKGVFKVNPTTVPKTIDVTVAGGPGKGRTHLGIYELNGDTYKVCIGLTGKPRPTEFTTKPGSGTVLEVFKRSRTP